MHNGRGIGEERLQSLDSEAHVERGVEVRSVDVCRETVNELPCLLFGLARNRHQQTIDPPADPIILTMSLASTASKRTLYGSIAFALFSVWGVHYAQRIESEVSPANPLLSLLPRCLVNEHNELIASFVN
jgi:hypothetical protein